MHYNVALCLHRTDPTTPRSTLCAVVLACRSIPKGEALKQELEAEAAAAGQPQPKMEVRGNVQGGSTCRAAALQAAEPAGLPVIVPFACRCFCFCPHCPLHHPTSHPCRSCIEDAGVPAAPHLRGVVCSSHAPPHCPPVQLSLQVMQLDLSSLQSVRDFAAAWRRSGRPLHVLVNNAGIFAMSAVSHACCCCSLHPHGCACCTHLLLICLLAGLFPVVRLAHSRSACVLLHRSGCRCRCSYHRDRCSGLTARLLPLCRQER